MEDCTRELSAARLRLSHHFPYLTTMVFRLIPISTNQIPTMAVDQWWRLSYNPEFLKKISVEEAAFCLFHECMHLFRNHHERARAGNCEHELYNMAGDFAINDDLAQLRDIKPPDGVLLPDQFQLPPHQLEEVYYDTLSKAHAKIKKQVEKAINEGKIHPGFGKCGSCAHGKKEPWELPGPGQKNGPRGISPQVADLVRGKVARDMVDHASKYPGSVPGGMRRVAEGLLKPKVKWQTKLRSAVRTAVLRVAGCVDFTFTKRSRKQSAVPDFVLPGMTGSLCRVAVAVDTSGSMSSEQLAQALAEIDGILRALQKQVEVTVLSVDVQVAKKCLTRSARKIELFGGGGTDMGNAVTAMAELKPRPDVAVVLTDGYTAWPENPPRGLKKIIVVILREKATSGAFPGFPGSSRIPGIYGGAEDDEAWGGPEWAEVIHVQ